MRVAGRIAFAALVPIFLGWALLEAEPGASARAPHESASLSTAAPVDDSPTFSPPANGTDAPATAESETDLYGNEVTDAVAEYGLDSTGSLYEMHAPQVELPKFSSPKS